MKPAPPVTMIMTCYSACDFDSQSSNYVGMQINIDIVFADMTNHAFRQTHFAFFDFYAGSGNGVGDSLRTDRTEQTAFIPGFMGDDNIQFAQSFAARGGCGQLFPQPVFPVRRGVLRIP